MAIIIINFAYKGKETIKKLEKDFKTFLDSDTMTYRDIDNKITMSWR
jgi:hypothetical protein